MSKLDLLIENFCPQGVSFKPLGEVVRFLNGRTNKQNCLMRENTRFFEWGTFIRMISGTILI